MKRIFLLVFVAISAIACDTEPLDPALLDPSNNPGGGNGSGNTNGDIVGTWNYEDYEIDVTTTTNAGGVPVSFTATTVLTDVNMGTVTFNADGTYVLAGELTYEVTFAGMTTPQTIDLTGSTGNYTLMNNIFTGDLVSVPTGSTAGNTDGIVFTVTTLDANTLEMDITGTQMQTVGGETIETEFDGFAIFNR